MAEAPDGAAVVYTEMGDRVPSPEILPVRAHLGELIAEELLCTTAPLSNAAGDIESVIEMCIDITQIR